MSMVNLAGQLTI